MIKIRKHEQLIDFKQGNCPKCNGDVEFRGITTLYRFHCLNESCDSWFM